jgi:hypothetical protein
MKNSSANPDPTIQISLDYLLELSDDGQPEENEVIVIPPVPPFPDGPAASPNQPDHS